MGRGAEPQPHTEALSPDAPRAGPADGYDASAVRPDLFLSFQPLVYRLIHRFGVDPELRQDLPGEIYLRFCLLLDLYDPARGVPLRAYLVRNLTTSVYSFSRSEWRRRAHEQVMSEPMLQADGRAEDPTHAWDDSLLKSDVLRLLPHLIAELPDRQRRAVTHRYFEDRSFEEIAELLTIQPATARSLLRHALNRLRRRLAEAGFST